MDIKNLQAIKDEVEVKKTQMMDDFYKNNPKLVDMQKNIDDKMRSLGLKSPDLKTSSGLYQVAVNNGLEKEANQIIKDNSGEEYKKIYEGGFISDIFDTLNLVSFGTVGVLKGKGFVEGVKNRESFADSDALGQYGLAGTIGGIALDIATDPLTYIAPWTIAKRIPGVARGVKFGTKAVFGETVEKTFTEAGKIKKVAEIEGGTRLGKFTAEKLKFMYGADNIFKETWQRMTRNIGVETTRTKELMQGIAKLDKELQGNLTDTLFTTKTGELRDTLIRKPLAEIQRDLSTEQFGKVKGIYDDIDNMGKELVDLGVLSKEAQEDGFGEYIHQYYQKYINAQKKPFMGSIGIKGTKKRSKELTQEGVEALGRVENPAYVLGRTMLEMRKDIENVKLFNKINDVHAVSKSLTGYSKVAGKKLGKLDGKYVPDYIAKELVPEMLVPTEKSMADRIMGEFKASKVIFSPAAMARNMVSNLTLNYWKLGLIPGDKVYAEAAKDIFNAARHGIDSKDIKLAKKFGYKADSFAANEIMSFYDPTDKSAMGIWNKMKNKMGALYQGEESFAKLAAFKKQIGKGIDPEEAWKAAESATFNYAEVTPFVRKMRTSWYGLPFITFSLKSAPLTVETAFKHPGRISVIGKIRNSIEEMSDYDETMREKENEAQWIKDGFFVKLPIKDKEGRSAFFDLTYILPFGDLVSGQFLERNVSRETGVKESIPSALLSKNPAFNFLKEISKNQDFTGNKIWKDSDSWEKQVMEINRHLLKSFAPPPVADQIPSGYNSKGERVTSGFYKALTQEQKDTQKRTVVQELLKSVGAKIQPVDDEIQESMNEWQKKKGMGTLLKDENVINDFSSFYIPK